MRFRSRIFISALVSSQWYTMRLVRLKIGRAERHLSQGKRLMGIDAMQRQKNYLLQHCPFARKATSIRYMLWPFLLITMIQVNPAAPKGNDRNQAQAAAVPSFRQSNRRLDKTIQVDVALVTVPVQVRGRKGEWIVDVKPSDFRIWENGVAQTIDRLIPEEEPFHIALMIDRSGSTAFKIEELRNAALAFLDTLRSQDRVMLVSFGSKASITVDFTEDRTRLRQAIEQMSLGSGRTQLYDAFATVLKRYLAPISGRKP